MRRGLEIRTVLGALRGVAYEQNAKLQELSDLVESALLAEKDDILTRADSAIAKADDEYRRGFIAECYGEDLIDVEESYPQIQRYALFGMVMAQLETNIAAICRAARRLLDLSHCFDRKRPRAVERGIKYLEGQAGLNTSKIKHYIQLADELRIVRNCIVHDLGNFRDRNDAEAIMAFVCRIPTVESDNYSSLKLKAGFVNTFAHEMYTLSQRLMDLLVKRLGEERQHQ